MGEIFNLKSLLNSGSITFNSDRIPWGSVEEPIEKKEPEVEEWVWVDGYKGTTSDMKCRDSQFELGHRYYMPEEEKVEVCYSGYHFCQDLEDVFRFYSIGTNNRFFKVKALVRKKDLEAAKKIRQNPFAFAWTGTDGKKLTSKAIEFVSEVDEDELFKAAGHEDFTEEERKTARMFGIDNILEERKKAEAKLNQAKLVELGYSEAFAALLMKKDKFKEAYAVGTQEGLSMDMKVLMIFMDEINDY